ncbi:RHS repeat-associated core domain-containing protein, partial [Streptomyces albiaxialis]|uniref:RHS repeat-associated core domain-containing protein n=1 Tax=Streptomyces albiaxialis TaxID=329523 RepID=UPI0031D569F3
AARYYDTRTGRFTQPDPSGLEANPYLYAAGDPTNLTDSSGLYWGEDLVKRIGGGLKRSASGYGMLARELWNSRPNVNLGCASGVLTVGAGIFTISESISSTPITRGSTTKPGVTAGVLTIGAGLTTMGASC